MTDAGNEWEQRVATCWASFRSDKMSGPELMRTIDQLAAERPAGDAAAVFEQACARDSAGHESEAEPLYCTALSSNCLDTYRRTRAVIQLGSTLRLLGRLEESEQMLREELERCANSAEPQPLIDETRAVLALTLLAGGKSVEAAVLALTALAPRLSRYQRSIFANAVDLGSRKS
jgi:hypothetical protein